LNLAERKKKRNSPQGKPANKQRAHPVIDSGKKAPPLAEALRQGGKVVQLMVESVSDYAIFMLDPTGKVASWNKGAQKIKQYKPHEIIGRHFSVFYPPEEIASRKPDRELEFASREGKFEEEGTRLRKDGTEFWANVVITAVRDETGELLGFTKVTRDLTERRAAQEQAIADARRVAQAEASNRTKTEFLAAMSHELRTPLNAIGGYTDLLRLGLGGTVSEEQIQYLDRIRRSQQHLLGIISDLLNFSRIESGHLSYDITPVHLADVLETVLPMVQPQAAAKGIAVGRGVFPSELTVLADRSKLDQILINLLSNAIKFTETGGRATVDCGTTEGTAYLTVSDTGCGIPQDKLEVIFEPFVQLGRSLISAHHGTGLGLAISRDLARAMSGDLTVSSEEGVGSTFRVTLPLHHTGRIRKPKR
jgi:PAS domain S-box-containing protein